MGIFIFPIVRKWLIVNGSLEVAKLQGFTGLGWESHWCAAEITSGTCNNKDKREKKLLMFYLKW